VKAVQTEVHDDQGNLVRIEVYKAGSGEHVFDALWDPADPQDEEHRKAFRTWVSRMIKSKNLEPQN